MCDTTNMNNDHNGQKNKYRLTISTHNVQSMNNPIKQQHIIQHMDLNNIDILGISETNLPYNSSKLIHRHNNQEYKYFFTSNKLKVTGSGVGLIIKNDIATHIFNHGSIDGRVIFVDIHSKAKQILQIIQIYLHASHKDIKECIKLQNDIIHLITQAKNKDYYVILIGDFNCDTKNR